MKRNERMKRNADDELTEEDVQVPLSTLVINKKTPVKIRDMADYSDIFFAMENTVLDRWLENPTLRDQDVLRAYTSLLKDFDHRPDGTLDAEIAKNVKALLLYRKKDKERDFTYGEVLSCLSMLITIAKQHRSSDGKGYLKWVKIFFDGKMPTNVQDILNYISQNEL